MLEAKGTKLKSADGWNDNGNGDNSSGFNARPGGCHVPSFGGIFEGIGNEATFWTSSTGRSNGGWCRDLVKQKEAVGRIDINKENSMYVRCIKDL